MSQAQDVDREYFEQHPTTTHYYRKPVLGEWSDITLPPEARVSVMKINQRARVRALEDAAGLRLAEPVLDRDEAVKQFQRAA